MYFGERGVTVHVFVLTLGYSRRSFYRACPKSNCGSSSRPTSGPSSISAATPASTSTIGRARCVGQARGAGRLERDLPGLRRVLGLRAAAVSALPGADQGQGRVGREVRQAQLPARAALPRSGDLDEQLAEWKAEIADVRIHGTTHERPIDRFARERAHSSPVLASPASAWSAPSPASWPATTS